MYDVAIIGGGMAGMATAARLQVRGLRTVVLEAHGQPGGCAGFFRRRGFAFDVGATTLVDFEPGGLGGELLGDIGMSQLPGEQLPGYVAWLPDRQVTLHRDGYLWKQERFRQLGDSPEHRRFWHRLDRLAKVFWQASRRGIKLPIQGVSDLLRAIGILGIGRLPLARFVRWTMGDALRNCRLRQDAPLVGLLSMLLEDTVHAGVDDAPLINGALGVTIRGAGLTRAAGGMFGFWRRFRRRYQELGGTLRVGCSVQRVEMVSTGKDKTFLVHTRRGVIAARQVVSTLPIELTSQLVPAEIGKRLERYVQRDSSSRGGAIVVFLGVPEEEVQAQSFTHHQLLQSYQRPLGNGNNMFVSVSAPGDLESAPAGHRAVMISTHCDLRDWEGLTADEYQQRKTEMGDALVSYARRVYPELGQRALVYEIGTPRTFARFTHRPRGAVGGVRQTLGNTNQSAVPQDIGVPGFWLGGDTTWPGLGTVACVLGSRIVAGLALRHAACLDGQAIRDGEHSRARKESHEALIIR
jgi:C-3',4' desaturase CrtD